MPDVVIWLAFLLAAGVVLWLMARDEKRRRVEPLPPPPVPVALRLVADHRQRLSGTHVSAVRPRDAGLVLSPVQRHAIAFGKKRKD